MTTPKRLIQRGMKKLITKDAISKAAEQSAQDQNEMLYRAMEHSFEEVFNKHKADNIVAKPMTLENMPAGTIIKSYDDHYRRVLVYLGGEGELATYAMSSSSRDMASDALKWANGVRTACQLAESGYSIYSPEEPVEMTVEEISKQLGKKIKVVK